jgi:solute carrier family 25 (mitochondrial carrier protein), member 16
MTPCSGVSVLPITYPFELVRVRMALETKGGRDRPPLINVFRTIYSEPNGNGFKLSGVFNFYRGFLVTFVGTVPYRGGIFLVWETLKQESTIYLSPEFRNTHRNKLNLTIGAIAGTTSQIVTYPLEVVRRMQQASGRSALQHLGFREAVVSIWRTTGWKGFYTGLGVGLVKQVPMHSISLAVWQAAKRILDVDV